MMRWWKAKFGTWRLRFLPGHWRFRKQIRAINDGNHVCAIVTRTTPKPKPGSGEISRACEESWIGTNGYVRSDGSRQKRALAFQGTGLTAAGKSIAEVFAADLPNDMTQPGDKPIAGTSEQRPVPPKGVVQRRLTFTTERKFPGLQGPRHWLRSSPDGSRIAFLMKDESGVAQIWTFSPSRETLRVPRRAARPNRARENATPPRATCRWNSTNAPTGPRRQLAACRTKCVRTARRDVRTRPGKIHQRGRFMRKAGEFHSDS
jgi:hypothetical protein